MLLKIRLSALLAFLSFAISAATFNDAGQYLRDTVLSGNARPVLALGYEQVLSAGDAQIKLVPGIFGEVNPPVRDFFLFVVDDAPGENWSHPCRYVFVKPDLSGHVVLRGSDEIEVLVHGKLLRPKAVVDFDWQKGRGEISGIFEGTESKTAASSPSRTRTLLSSREIIDGSHTYAVLISGGIRAGSNHLRYWYDIALAYNTLRGRYNVPKDNIKVLFASGDPASDLCVTDKTSPINCSCRGYDCPIPDSPKDFDRDGTDDIDGAATPANVVSLFRAVTARLTPEDQLLVFVTDHGGDYTKLPQLRTASSLSPYAYINLWGEGLVMTDANLADITKDINCPVMFALETCFSGGCIDEITNSAPNRVIATADGFYESSAGVTVPYYDQWAYCFFSALRGYFPKDGEHPEQDGEACDADMDGDGQVSFYEAAMFAYKYRYSEDIPQYAESSPGYGRSFFPVATRKTVQTPVFASASGSVYWPPYEVYVTCPTEGATIRYTVDGSEPTESSEVYAGRIRLTADATVKARAFKGGMKGSATARADYLVRREAPAAATSVSASYGKDGTGIHVSWDCDWQGATGCEVRRSVSASMSGAVVIADRLPSGTLSYLDSTAVPEVDYYYQVVLFNGYGASSSAVSSPGRRKLLPPSNVSVSWISNLKYYQVYWSAVQGASYYRVYRAIGDTTPVAISEWQTATSIIDVPEAPIGTPIRYYVASSTSSTGVLSSELCASAVQTMQDVRDWELVIEKNATGKCQMRPGDTKWFRCYLRYSDGKYEEKNFTTGVNWEIVQSASRVTRIADTDGSCVEMGSLSVYTPPQTTLKTAAGDYEEEVTLRATFTRNGETRSCSYPILVSNRKIVSGVSVGARQSYVVPGESMALSCLRSYVNSTATGDEDIGVATFSILSGGGATLSQDGMLTTFPTDVKTNITVQVTYENADGFFTASRKIDISPQTVSVIELEIPAEGGYSPTNSCGYIGYRSGTLNSLSWSMEMDVQSWVSRFFCQVRPDGAGATLNFDLGRGNVNATTPYGQTYIAFYADRNGGPDRTTTLPFRWNGGGLDFVIRQRSAEHVSTPEAELNGNILSSGCSTAGAVLRYALDGEEPTEYSPECNGNMMLSSGTSSVAIKGFAEWMLPSKTVYLNGNSGGVGTATVVFDARGGHVDEQERTYLVGDRFGVLPVPSWDAKTFAGWAIGSESGAAIVGEQDIISDPETTLYAVWSDGPVEPRWIVHEWEYPAFSSLLFTVRDIGTGAQLKSSDAKIGVFDSLGDCRGVSQIAESGGELFSVPMYGRAGDTDFTLKVWHKQTGEMNVVTPVLACDFTVLYPDEAEILVATSCSISYESRFGGVLPSSENVEYAATLVVPSSDGLVSPPGYEFEGWSAGDTVYSPGDIVESVRSNMAFVAVWTAVRYVIGFDGGSNVQGTPPLPIEATVESPVTLPGPGTLSKGAGYEFTGWSDGTSVYPVGFEYVIPARNVTMVALWKLSGLDEVLGPSADLFAFDTSGAADWFVTDGKSYDAGGTSMRSGEIGAGATSVLTATAKSAGTLSFKWACSCDEPGYAALIFAVNGSERLRIGNETGWTLVDDIDISAGDTLAWTYWKKSDAYEVGSDCGWVDAVSFGKKTTVTFVADGGTPATSNVVAFAGEPIGELPYPTWQNYSLDHWTDPTGGVVTASWIVPEEDVTLVAVTKDKEWRVTYDLAGGTAVTVTNESYKAGTTFALPGAASATKDGYALAGWADGTATCEPGAIRTVPGGDDLAFVAVWQPDYASALNCAGSGIRFASGGDAEWTVQADKTSSGATALRSGVIGGSGQTSPSACSSWVEATVVGPGTLSFDWAVSCDDGYNGEKYAWAACAVNNSPAPGADLIYGTGNESWRTVTLKLTGEMNVIRWTFEKKAYAYNESSNEAGQDRAWLDNLVWTPDAPPDFSGVVVTPSTSLADIGVTSDAFKDMTGFEAISNLVAWAQANGKTVADVNAMTFSASGDPIGDDSAAYLLNCATSEIEAEAAKFKVTSISVDGEGNVTVTPADSSAYGNGHVEVRYSADIDGEYTTGRPKAGSRCFMKLYLVK